MTLDVVYFKIVWNDGGEEFECLMFCCLYKYLKYLGFDMISFGLLTYSSLSHKPMMLFVMDML